MKTMKKHISAPRLLQRVRQAFLKIPDKAGAQRQIALVDFLMSGLALFGLKEPSLLQFDKDQAEPCVKHNLQTLYQIEQVPCDTRLRERLDVVEPSWLRRAYTRVFSALQRGKKLEPFVYHEDCYLLSIDGTGCFSSPTIHCSSCCVKRHKDGHQTYYHQMLGAVLVHPDQKVVIPLAPEPILKTDGATKNDCERNAAKRLLETTRREHPHLKVIVTEDGLSSNAPHISLLEQLGMHYILGAKPDDHKNLFDFVKSVWLEQDQKEERDSKGTLHRYRWVNEVPLNDSHPERKVNFLAYWEIPLKGRLQHFTWVTDLPLAPSTVNKVMKGGRARWRIENETFNTLKNQGYYFEHNFGHGYQHLNSVLAMLMFLAFLIDQAQQLSCTFFQAAWKKVKRKCYLWDEIRIFFKKFFILSWQDLYEAIIQRGYGTLRIDTS